MSYRCYYQVFLVHLLLDVFPVGTKRKDILTLRHKKVFTPASESLFIVLIHK